jgi:hypothetical protein
MSVARDIRPLMTRLSSFTDCEYGRANVLQWDLATAMAKLARNDRRVMDWNADYTINIRVNYRDSRSIWFRSSADPVYIQEQFFLP